MRLPCLISSCALASWLLQCTLHEAIMRRPTAQPDYVSLSVRVSRETYEAIKAIAEAQYRPVAAELRRIIEERIAEAQDETPA